MTTKITLIPGLEDPNLKLQLEGLLDNCIRFRGCTAFWTIPINFFSSKVFAKALKKKGSFFCTDIQLPTDISNIKEYYDYGATNIYLHHYRLLSKYEYLLHSKILVFDMNEAKAVIWIGSHNLTSAAITGLNLEASVAIECSITDKIYKDTCAYLEVLKNDFCVKFDPNLIDIYLKLQKDEDKNAGDITETLEIVGEQMHNLKDENFIQLLSGSGREFYKYKMTGTEIYLHAYDISTKMEHLYKCKIEQAGKLGKDNKLELDFVKERRFAKIQTGSRMPYPLLYPQTKINDKILGNSQYFVNIAISYKVENIEIYYKPSKADLSFWQSDTANPYFMRQSTSHHYKILKATFDKNVKKKLVDLKGQWKSLGVDNARRYRHHLEDFKNHFNETKNGATMEVHWFDYKYWYDNQVGQLIAQSRNEGKENKKPIPSLKLRIVVENDK